MNTFNNIKNNNIIELKSIEDARMNSRRHRIYYRNLRATSALIVLNFKLRLQSPLWLNTFHTPCDDVWYLNFVEGPHRKRKKLMRHRDFNRMYKISKTKFFDLLSKYTQFQQYYFPNTQQNEFNINNSNNNNMIELNIKNNNENETKKNDDELLIIDDDFIDNNNNNNNIVVDDDDYDDDEDDDDEDYNSTNDDDDDD
eukprot:40860_1